MKRIAVLAGAFLYSSALFGQGRGGPPLARIAPSDKAFDPHDLSGIWTRNGTPGGYGGGGTCADCGDRGLATMFRPSRLSVRKCSTLTSLPMAACSEAPTLLRTRKKPSAGAVLFPPRTELTPVNIAIPKA